MFHPNGYGHYGMVRMVRPTMGILMIRWIDDHPAIDVGI
jgi:hypothetical protein